MIGWLIIVGGSCGWIGYLAGCRRAFKIGMLTGMRYERGAARADEFIVRNGKSARVPPPPPVAQEVPPKAPGEGIQ